MAGDPTDLGCNKGVGCMFCHFLHARKPRPRLCKGKRDRFNRLTAEIEEVMGVDGESAKVKLADCRRRFSHGT